MKNPDRRIILFLALVVMIVPAVRAAEKMAGFGEIVRFAKNHEVTFPDFGMTYRGERRVSDPVFKPGFTYYDFEVRSAKGRQTVSWSSGTGEIGSVSFTVDGHPYELELRGSVLKKGWLREDEMVVWPRAQFLDAAEARNRAAREK
jgi:hypothetical protein